MATIDKQPLTSMNITEEQLLNFKQLFPEVFTEGLKVDWEKLKLTLGETVDAGKERYGMNWPGKADCFKTIQQPSIATLVPCPEESLKPDGTPYQAGEGFSSNNHINQDNQLNHSSDNLFIEGDNLEVLKLLQKSYLGKVKMIYIDPPYNTGNEFIYPDNYSESLETYLEYTGQVDSTGKKFGTNTDTDGRFHSKWLNMMYPRLFLAKNLLREDGVIFISIDDNEVHNLRALCNEIFGEENFIENLIWKRRATPPNDRVIGKNHEYVIMYAKSNDAVSLFLQPRSEKLDSRYSNPDNDVNGLWCASDLSANGKGGRLTESCIYEIINPNNGVAYLPPQNKCWLYNKEKVDLLISEGKIGFRANSGSPFLKRYLSEVRQGVTLATILDNHGFSQDSAKEIKEIFNSDAFDFPKPTKLIKSLLVAGLNEDDIILDFFAGSATTAHALLEINKDGGNRKFICVQIPEPTDERSEAFKAGYENIAEISKERIRRVSTKIKKEQDENALKEAGSLFSNQTNQEYKGSDLGFKVFKLDHSNFKIWDATLEKEPEAIQARLFEHIDHISPEAAQESILYELLLKSGFELTTPIEKLSLADKTVFSIAGGQLLICLEKELSHDCIKAMAEMQPTRVICLDEAFTGINADALKTNAVQIMKSKGVVNFRTV